MNVTATLADFVVSLESIRKEIDTVAQRARAAHGELSATGQQSHAGLPTYLTMHEVAEMLKIDVRTAQRWAARGVFPSVRIEGQLRADRDAFKEWLATQPSAGDFQPTSIPRIVSRRRRAS